jgi:predicted nucleic acid-binding protein
MADKVVLVDTSILINYYRKTDKEKSIWITLIRKGFSFAVSAVKLSTRFIREQHKTN